MKTENMPITVQGLTHSENSLADITGSDFAAIVPVIPGQIGGRETSIVSAKALHKALGVGKDFSSWITDRITDYGFGIGSDYAVHKLITPKLGKSPNNKASSPIAVGRPGRDYLLTISTAKEISMLERNEQGRAVRRYFIQCEEALQLSAPAIAAKYRRQLKARIGAANMFTPMCAALEAARAEQGKQTLARHYSNESNMIARIVLAGQTAKQWALANNVAGEPRDGMNAEQLEHLTYLESTNITLIDMGLPYEQRQPELVRLSQRWLAKRLGVSHD